MAQFWNGIDTLNKRYAELNKMLDNYNPNDSSKTFDGSSVESLSAAS
ncbi:hypothetical protein [Neisseria weixii]|nr:hypothetical protein [Neisseria weixii]